MAYTFNGSDETIYWTTPVNPMEHPFTVSIWFKDDGTAVNDYPWSSFRSASQVPADRYALELKSDNTLDFLAFHSGGPGTASSTNTYTNDAWSHACGIETDTTTRRSILNGDWANSGTNATSKNPGGNDRMSIAAWYDDTTTSNFLGADLAELAIWNAALTQPDVEALAEGLSPLKVVPGSLIFYAPLVRGLQDHIGAATATTS